LDTVRQLADAAGSGQELLLSIQIEHEYESMKARLLSR